MKPATILIPALFTIAAAAPLEPRADECPPGVGSSRSVPDDPHMNSFVGDPRLKGTELGTTKIAPRCLAQATHNVTTCAVRLPSGNKIVMGWHQPIKEDFPNCDATHPVDNGLGAGVAKGADGSVKERNALSIFPSFPAEAAGKRCRLHFITDSGVNIRPSKFRDWDIFSLAGDGAAATLRTTWSSKPPRGPKLATVAITEQMAAPVKHSGKFDHRFLSGPGSQSPDDQTFPCPAPGAHVAWEIAVADHEKQKWQKNWTDSAPAVEMFIGGVLGLGIELVDTPETSYDWSM